MPSLTSKLFTDLAAPPTFGMAGTGDILTAHRLANAGNLRREPLKMTLAWHLLLPVAVFSLSLLEISIAHHANYAGVFWPSSAIVLIALMRHERNFLNVASIIVGGAAAMELAGIVGGDKLPLSIVLTVANTAEVVVAFLLLTLFRIDASNLSSFRNLLLFIAVAGGIAPIASTAICSLALNGAAGIPWQRMWRNWYAGHALGMIIVAPFLFSITSQTPEQQRVKERLPEIALVVALILAIGACVAYFRPIILVIAPVILFATVRFGLIGATTTTCFIAIIASCFVVLGVGQPLFNLVDLSDRILSLQAYLAITTFWSLPTAALLTERDRLLNDLSQVNARLTAEGEQKSNLVIGLRRHLTMAEEKERLRLSHELHDQAGQGLIAAILELNEIDALVAGGPRDRLHLVRKKMEELGKTLHRIAWELRPASIDELGLRKALSSYVTDWGERCGIDVDLHCDNAALDDVPSDIGTAVYRVAQEGLTNIVKHAQRPSDVSVIVRRTGAVLQIIIEDNGSGFDTAAAAAARQNGRRGLGLDGMRERLSLIGGTLEVESTIGGGTTLFARIALDAERSAA
ncbi:MAG TPA: MASE1 domain-containing protein [Xanthobacteraceae bacterium]|jgi:signal transduction histidine kinase|nr:MASE1 domain-containing protein [Xanthobacteraceae bacterium]